jgi:glycosyltransferase involved in cell wall biosynthesis
MVKILSIVWYQVLPAKYGGQKGIAFFNKYLGKQLSLVCLCSKDNEKTEYLSYELSPVLPQGKWQFLNPLCWRKIIRTAEKEKPTHIILEHPYHGIAGWLAKKSTGAKLVIHSHNLEHLRFKERNKWWWRLLRSYERWVHRKADLNLFKTSEDLEQAVRLFKLHPDKCTLLPYGTDPEEMRLPKKEAKEFIAKRHGLNLDEVILLFSGTLDYKPNADAVLNIYKELAPRLTRACFTGKIIICGRNKSKPFQYQKKLSHPLVIQAGEVNDIENYFAAAGLFINPVLTGGGIQTKNIDAISYNLPVVGFENMLAGLESSLCPGKIFKASAGNWDRFTEKIEVALCSTPALTPPSFYTYYSFAIQTEKLAARLKSG